MPEVRTTKASNKGRRATRGDDIQKARLYKWEVDRGWTRNSDGFDICAQAILGACDLYGVEAPHVTQHFTWSDSYYLIQDRSATGDPDLLVISLQAAGNPYKKNSGQLNLASALHEAAHHICWLKWGYRLADHGPTFVGVLGYLLCHFGVTHEGGFRLAMRLNKIKWRHMSPALYVAAH